MTVPEVLIFKTHEELAVAAADHLRRVAEQAVSERGKFLLVLSGGSTPKPLYRLLATAPYREELPWKQTHVFWADERAVPPDSSESNYGMTHEILLRHVDLPEDQIHRMRGEVDTVSAVDLYTQELLEVAEEGRAWPRFDLVILGLGGDGHTASLFPGSTFPLDEAQPVLAVQASYGDRPAGRITLTPPALNDAQHIFFLVAGVDKADAVAATLSSERNPAQYPAQRIQPEAGTAIWFVDQGAAAKLNARTAS